LRLGTLEGVKDGFTLDAKVEESLGTTDGAKLGYDVSSSDDERQVIPGTLVFTISQEKGQKS